MFEDDYVFFRKYLANLNRFNLCGTTYAPFVSQDKDLWNLMDRPDIFWHLVTSSKTKDCTNNSPIVPCCNTLEMSGCDEISEANDVLHYISRVPCPYRARGMRSLKLIMDSLAYGNVHGISAALYKDQSGAKKMVIRRKCGCLDYVCIFKCYPYRYEAKGTVRPIRLITAFPLAYRSMIRKFDKIIGEQGLTIEQ